MIYVDKAAALVGVKAYVSPGLITSIVKVFAVVTVCNGRQYKEQKELQSLPDPPYFDFKPYDYGPFDKDVYSALDSLKESGQVVVNHNSRYRKFALTEDGYLEGMKALEDTSEPARAFIKDAAKWVQETSFQDMVSAIYTKYPEMKANSIFRS